MAPVVAVNGVAWGQAGRTKDLRAERPNGDFHLFRTRPGDLLNPAVRERTMFVHHSEYTTQPLQIACGLAQEVTTQNAGEPFFRGKYNGQNRTRPRSGRLG